MTEQHPITPSPKLVQQWVDAWLDAKVKHVELYEFLAIQGSRWGADQELEACCAIAISDPVCGTKHQRYMLVRHIREQRRPKPQSLKEQAHEALGRFLSNAHTQAYEMSQDFEIIRRALEQLDD